MSQPDLPLSIVEAMLRADTVHECWSVLERTLDGYGFDRIIYGYTRFREGRNLGDEDSLLLLSNFPQDYLDAFVGRGLFKSSRMMRWAWNGDGARTWSDIAAEIHDPTEAEREVAEFNRSRGVEAGVTMAFPSAWRRSKGVAALTARHGLTQDDVDALWSCEGRAVEALCRLAHRLIVTLPADGIGPRLTDRQREVLEWVGDGKAVADVALVMGLSVPTVEKHLRLARANLGAETTAQAVLKAQALGRIYRMKLDEPG
ncbi:DNA-binding CsgD family transcriptional regulator [Hasllibacter halocynthiae]|uniref:DNA-binding CsgD family transcriptional regulator n=1 Tax=Hasllibacter halocynthiae TaxID=595589 RepID=A0A2T0X866_9RHOB|nr:LuxR family transcriptional regulator [Hasllibacter halocynthiae]PRY95141.1 DNA-binding CsgD family transcriptional regulator [Hasllibacter halocynthiae]